MKVFSVEIDMDNDAFSDGNHVDELREIFAQIADKMDRGFSNGYVFDTNGNRVGKFIIEYEDEFDDDDEEE